MRRVWGPSGADETFQRLSNEKVEEMVTAVEMMREGMPKTALQVRRVFLYANGAWSAVGGLYRIGSVVTALCMNRWG